MWCCGFGLCDLQKNKQFPSNHADAPVIYACIRNSRRLVDPRKNRSLPGVGKMVSSKET